MYGIPTTTDSSQRLCDKVSFFNGKSAVGEQARAIHNQRAVSDSQTQP